MTSADETDARLRAIEAFARACSENELVAAAFLGGSFASGKADAWSDLDLYVVCADEDYDGFFAARERFMNSWTEPVLLDTTLNFIGLGFDMVHFLDADGVTGEIALGRPAAMHAMHGGPHRVLVDKGGLLAGVEFPLYEPSADEKRAATQRALKWFVFELVVFAKCVARDDVANALRLVGQLRNHCAQILSAAATDGETSRTGQARLLATYTAADLSAVAVAGVDLVQMYRELGPRAAEAIGQVYPQAALEVAEAKLEKIRRTRMPVS
jgi:predicted nucleotidyltransferase